MYFDCRVPHPVFIKLNSRATTDTMQAIEEIIRSESADITERVSIDSKVKALRVSVSFLGNHHRLIEKLCKYRQGVSGVYEFPLDKRATKNYDPVLKAAVKRFHQELSSTSTERYNFHKYKPAGY